MEDLESFYKMILSVIAEAIAIASQQATNHFVGAWNQWAAKIVVDEEKAIKYYQSV